MILAMTMKVKLVLTAFSVPVTVIVLGSIWHFIQSWDLTQPQAVVIAGIIGGPFLLAAATIAFQGQSATRKEERKKFNRQMRFEERKFRSELKQQRQQAKRDAERQSKQLNKQLTAAAELEREKQRRERAFDLINRAIAAILDLRTAFFAIPPAVLQDLLNLEKGGTNSNLRDEERPLSTAATDKADETRTDVSQVAAVFMVLGYDEPYERLMDLSNLVGRVLARPEPLYDLSPQEQGQFMQAYGFALISLRGIYEPLKVPAD